MDDDGTLQVQVALKMLVFLMILSLIIRPDVILRDVMLETGHHVILSLDEGEAKTL